MGSCLGRASRAQIPLAAHPLAGNLGVKLKCAPAEPLQSCSDIRVVQVEMIPAMFPLHPSSREASGYFSIAVSEMVSAMGRFFERSRIGGIWLRFGTRRPPSGDATYLDIFREFSHMASNDPEKLKRRSLHFSHSCR
ncbi:hypothetical protein Q9233_010942 [Columba guinea]|nr:hypothetical protein Q9233_010942 [Columba guinea]